MRRGGLLMAGAASAMLAACTTPAPITGLPAVTVTARGETVPVGTAAQDAADDPAIWRNAANPLASLIVATDKKAGLYVYGLDGAIRHFSDAGLVNNVDLAEVPGHGVIVVASDRNDLANARLQFHRLDTQSGALSLLGTAPGGVGEGYGLCLGEAGGVLRVYSVLKEGRIHEYRVDPGAPGSAPVLTAERTLTVASQPEGCVVDPRDGTLFVGEEVRGLWRFAAGAQTGELIAPIDNAYLVADLEGLAIAPDGATGGYLIASSQGDNAYAVFSLSPFAPVGRFRIAAGAFGATEETDGIALTQGGFGPDYPQGLFIAQDGINLPAAQNFKLVSWAEIKAALALD